MTGWFFVHVKFLLFSKPHTRLLSQPAYLFFAMSIPTAQEIELQLSLYDIQVRRAVQDGKIIEYMSRHHDDIVSAEFFFL
jgi:hypothetical protein